MSKKLTRNTKVTTAYNKKADFWKFSATMIAPILMGILFGFLVAIVFKLDYVQLVIAMLWIPVTWAVVVGDRPAAEFLESFQKPPKFSIKRRRRTKIFRR